MINTRAVKRYAPRYRIAEGASRDDALDLETILARVKAGIEELQQEYLGEARDELTELSASVAAAQTSAGAERSAAIDRIFRISHDLRGVASSFDYPLVTRIGTSLCHMIENRNTIDALALAVIDLHVGAMKVIMSNRITGEGDSKTHALIGGIDAAVRKCGEKPADS
jgi:chemotaxis protein histidine kinase CheA